MSQATSPSTGKPYGLARVCRVWGVARSTLYWQRHASSAPGTRRGPVGPCTDDELVDHIRRILEASPFPGEGYRKVWARRRHGGLRTPPRRVLRLMRTHHLLAPTRQGRPHGPKAHDGTIITPHVDTMWGTDMTSTFTRQEGQVAIFIAVDHCSAECVGIHAAKQGRPGLKRWSRSAKASVWPLGRSGTTSRRAWCSVMIVAVNICRMCFRRNGFFWGSPVRRPLSANPKATAVQSALSGHSRRTSYGSQPLIPWKSCAWRCAHFGSNITRLG
jgi:hypothetical protein